MRHFFILALAAIILSSCSTTTSVTGSWKNDKYSKREYKKVAVFALTSSTTNRMIVEKTFADRLIYLGYEAIQGSPIILPDIVKQKNDTLIAKILRNQGVDAVLLLSVLDIRENTHYVPGSSGYYPGPYYGHFYDYYYFSYDRVYTPGYYQTSTQVYLESNLYDLNDGSLVTSIQTETIDPANIDDLADSFSKTILLKLIKMEILENNSKK